MTTTSPTLRTAVAGEAVGVAHGYWAGDVELFEDTISSAAVTRVGELVRRRGSEVERKPPSAVWRAANLLNPRKCYVADR